MVKGKFKKLNKIISLNYRPSMTIQQLYKIALFEYQRNFRVETLKMRAFFLRYFIFCDMIQKSIYFMNQNKLLNYAQNNNENFSDIFFDCKITAVIKSKLTYMFLSKYAEGALSLSKTGRRHFRSIMEVKGRNVYVYRNISVVNRMPPRGFKALKNISSDIDQFEKYAIEEQATTGYIREHPINRKRLFAQISAGVEFSHFTFMGRTLGYEAFEQIFNFQNKIKKHGILGLNTLFIADCYIIVYHFYFFFMGYLLNIIFMVDFLIFSLIEMKRKEFLLK
jgi:hypothetical protein